MKKPTYKEQFDKLTAAYIQGAVNPYKACACFVGNLLNGDARWSVARHYLPNGKSFLCSPSTYAFAAEGVIDCLDFGERAVEEQSGGFYSSKDVLLLENTFLATLEGVLDLESYQAEGLRHEDLKAMPRYEDALFTAFEATLKVLRDVHIVKGEQVDSTLEFKRREPVKHITV